MTQLTPDLLRQATNGTWVARMPEIELPPDRPADMPPPPPSALCAAITGVSTDTRSIAPGNVFVALRGERFDGHDYLLDAARAGAVALIVDDLSRVPADGFKAATRGEGVGILKVADTGKALLSIAAAYRKAFTRTKVIAVCGSNGKTTTTRFIHHVLSAAMKGSHSPKSFNNAVGVPLTLLAVQPGDQFVVCEVGTSAPGEIAMLGDVVRPDIAVITSIGREHLEFLKDLAGVAREEAAIAQCVKPKGCVVLSADSPELAPHAGTRRDCMYITFGLSDRASLRATDVRHVELPTAGGAGGKGGATAVGAEGGGTTFGVSFGINGRTPVTIPVLGRHNAVNALAAIAVARRLNIDDARVREALGTLRLPELRLDQRRVRLKGGEATVIADCYNANPDSMQAALLTLMDVPWTGRRVAVLGDMLELGPGSPALHEGVLTELAGLAPDSRTLAVLVGEMMRSAAPVLHRAGWSSDRVVVVSDVDSPELCRGVADLLEPGDLVLLKGSRRMGLERVLGLLEGRPGKAAGLHATVTGAGASVGNVHT